MKHITLLSDLGLHDASVASVKGTLYQQVPGAVITDITHLAEPFRMQQAAYLLQSAWRDFPPRTVHVILFDVFAHKNPRLLLCEKDQHFFLAPDNGILALALGEQMDNIWEVYELSYPDRFQQWIAACGYAANIVFDDRIQTSYERTEMTVAPRPWQPVISHNQIECHVIYIDRFGNVVLNLTESLFEEVRRGRSFKLYYMRNEEVDTLNRYYYEMPIGGVMCRFNKSGFMEIVINQQSAADLLGLQLNYKEQLFYNTVKIFFE